VTTQGSLGGPLVLWTLAKASKVLRCELRQQTADSCSLEVLEDDRLAFSHRCSFSAQARFLAASFRREKLRDGWVEVARVTASSTKASFVFESLALVATAKCRYAPELMVNLNEALQLLNWPNDYQLIETDSLSEMDPIRGYPSPTLLWKGIDIFGMPEPSPPVTTQERAYENGVPSAATLASRLRQLREIG
jgi:hypothetical protein